MANPIYDMMNANNDGGIMNFVKEVQDFQKTFNGDPKAEVQNLMNSGQLSQAEFDQYAKIANQVMAFMPKMQ